MPIVDDEKIRALLADETISAITVDTNIFDQKRLQLNSASMKALATLKDRHFGFLLAGTVAKEVLAHLEKAAAEAFQNAKKGIGKALFAFETEVPTRNELLELITGGRTPAEAASQRWEKFVDDTGCEVIDDAKLVDTAKAR